MGGNVSCFYPADEDYECTNARAKYPLPISPSEPVVAGRNTNSTVIAETEICQAPVIIDGDCATNSVTSVTRDQPSNTTSNATTGRPIYAQNPLPRYRAEILGYSLPDEGKEQTSYNMFVRNVNNSFGQVDRILSQRMLMGLQRRYGCTMVQHMETALFRGNEVRLVTIEGPSKSQICKFRSALPISLTRYLITGMNHSADVDDVLDT